MGNGIFCLNRESLKLNLAGDERNLIGYLDSIRRKALAEDQVARWNRYYYSWPGDELLVHQGPAYSGPNPPHAGYCKIYQIEPHASLLDLIDGTHLTR